LVFFPQDDDHISDIDLQRPAPRDGVKQGLLDDTLQVAQFAEARDGALPDLVVGERHVDSADNLWRLGIDVAWSANCEFGSWGHGLERGTVDGGLGIEASQVFRCAGCLLVKLFQPYTAL